MTSETIPCRECGEPSGWNRELINQPLFGGNESVAVCDSCCDDYHAREDLEEPAPFPLLPLNKLLPPLYLQTNPTQLPKTGQNLWAQIKGWKPDHTGKGIYILGQSRTGKTRTMCLLLQSLHTQGIGFKLFLAGEFHTAMLEAKRGPSYRVWRDECIKAPVLAIDDLFAEKITEASQAALFEIIEQRMGLFLPVIITTQVKKKNAIELFPDPKRGESLLNRLRESCQGYVTNQSENQIELAA